MCEQGDVIDRDEAREARLRRDLEAGEEIRQALTAANIATVLRHRRMGIPLLIWRDGKMVEISVWDCPVPTLEPRTEPK